MEHQTIGEPGRSPSRVALLVDGDNIPVDRAGQLLVRAGRLGQVTVKRVYVDPQHLKNWEMSAGFGLCVARTGRGASDLMLAIDAVDLFHGGGLGAMVIASTDGGFAPLAGFLVERGLAVLGLGTREAPEDWRRSCSRYEVLPSLSSDQASPVALPSPTLASVQEAVARIDPLEKVIELVRNSADGVLRMTTLGDRMKAMGVSRSDLAERTWQVWVAARADVFRLEGQGTGLRVRLR